MRYKCITGLSVVLIFGLSLGQAAERVVICEMIGEEE